MRDADSDAFLDLIRLQGHNQMVTKTELLHTLHERGVPVGSRALATFINERVVPKSARLGSRSGLFPALVVELVAWVHNQRAMSVSYAAIRDLLPVWRYLTGAGVSEPREVDLAVFGDVLREHVRSPEAAAAVPWMLSDALAPLPGNEPRSPVLVRHGGTGSAEPTSWVVTFVVTEPGHHERGARTVAQLDLFIPQGPATHDVQRVTLPVGASAGTATTEASTTPHRPR